MANFHRYFKIFLNTLTVLILSYVTLAAAAEFIVDQTAQNFSVGGKTVAAMDIYKGDVIRIPYDELVLQNVLFPGLDDIFNITPNGTKKIAAGGLGKLHVECAVHAQAPSDTALN